MRLIDADELVAELIYLYEDRGWHEREIHFSLADMRCNVEIIPTVDAVEVVRCKDCVYSYPFDEEELKDLLRVGEWRCEFWYAEMHEDDYCSCGERRENGK